MRRAEAEAERRRKAIERAQAALTKFKVAADAYPSTDAGIYARYQEGATSLSLGATPGAIAAY